ncbi:MAG TPA: tail fiber protein [Ornithinibacter sp.]|nr:tail fiber protein [Ornithinibacter sp.]
MSEPFLSEIRLMSFVFPPKGWALCNGQLLPINQNQALFALLGTTYGGDGRVTFALPDLRGRVAAHVGDGHTLGEVGGQAAHTVTVSEMPSHSHMVVGTTATATTRLVGPTVGLAASTGSAAYSPPGSPVAMAANALGSAGSSQPHENRQPFLTLSFCIALQGIFPSPS